MLLCSQFILCQLLLVLAALVVQYMSTYGLSWTDKPGNLTYVQQGRNISIRWHYEINSSEQFLSSELFLKSKSLALASRYQDERSYTKYALSKRISFSVYGQNNITLTILDARLSYNGQYCCIVMVKMKTKKGKKAKRMCTTLFVYAVPHITSHTPKLSCKQGDQVKLQCIVTGYPEPRVEWIHRNTHKIIRNSSVTSVNISGKRSGGNYCCYATNQFGNDTKCTSVVVTEYGPANAILSRNRGYNVKSNTFTLQCQADASPPPRYLFFQNNTLIHNSSNGIYISSNISGHEAVQISCIPWNKYGQGPKKMIILPVFDELLWIEKPDTFTYGPQGSNISMRWHYKIGSKETFLHSEIRFKSGSLDLASRHTSENSYVAMELTGDTKVPFSVVGKTNVTLTVYNAEFSYVGEYCCEVTVKINNLKPREETCTNLYVYVLPRITYYTPDQSCKQGDQVKLYCNATGYPHPQFKWTRRDANKTIANSSVTSLNITGKRSSGRYCCYVTNRFGDESNCTSVLVTEFQPIETTLSSRTTYIIKNKMFQLRCNADAQPPPYYIFLQNNKQIYNSSDGIYTSDNITGDKAIYISCIPWNKYGKGPRKIIILPVYDPPKITSDLRTRYNITDKSINITCLATGIPAPNITLTERYSGKVVSTKGYYEVPYDKCDNGTLTFYCQASNMVGSVNSTEIQVQVMTSKGYSVGFVNFCKVTNKRTDYKIAIIFAVSVAVVLLLLFVLLVLSIIWKLKNKQNAEIEESPYQEPIDSIPITVAGKGKRVVPVNEEYATVEEVGFIKGKWPVKSKKEQPESDEKPLKKQSEEPIYALVKK